MQVDPENSEATRLQLGEHLATRGLPLMGIIPNSPMLASICLDDVQTLTCATPLAGLQSLNDIGIDQVCLLLVHTWTCHTSGLYPCLCMAVTCNVHTSTVWLQFLTLQLCGCHWTVSVQKK